MPEKVASSFGIYNLQELNRASNEIYKANLWPAHTTAIVVLHAMVKTVMVMAVQNIRAFYCCSVP